MEGGGCFGCEANLALELTNEIAGNWVQVRIEFYLRPIGTMMRFGCCKLLAPGKEITSYRFIAFS
jgi:hypothetical protein